MLPTHEELEEYISVATEYIQGISDGLNELYGRLQSDFRRHSRWPTTNGTPSVFELDIPASILPIANPPPRIPWYRLGFIKDKDTRLRVAIGIAGIGIGVGCGAWMLLRGQDERRRREESFDRHKLRREVVVVLGGDTLVGPALVHSLEKKGYVVIASVATADAVDRLEKTSKGNVKALVLNPREPASVPYFLRSLNAALALRFPIGLPGDPYLPTGSSPSASPTTNVLVSCISLLSIDPTPIPTPLERLELSKEYLPLICQVHITPLATIQGILPLFRVATGRQGVGHARHKHSSTSVIVLVPAVSSRVGVAFDGARAMAIAGMVRGTEVLRREIGNETNVILVDVGTISTPDTGNKPKPTTDMDIVELTKAWSAGEKRAYRQGYEAALVHSSTILPSSPTRKHKRRTQIRGRTPTDIDTLISTIVPLVHVSKFSKFHYYPSYMSTHIYKMWQRLILYLRGYRISVGAGALTYTAASQLPHWLLDTILSLPEILVSWKNALAPMSPSLESYEDGSRAEIHQQGRPFRLIESDERGISTAPASTASADSRRESLGSFEGMSLDSVDEEQKLTRGRDGTVIGEDKHGQAKQMVPPPVAPMKSLSEGLARTPSLVINPLPGQIACDSTSGTNDRIADSWVSLGESRMREE